MKTIEIAGKPIKVSTALRKRLEMQPLPLGAHDAFPATVDHVADQLIGITDTGIIVARDSGTVHLVWRDIVAMTTRTVALADSSRIDLLCYTAADRDGFLHGVPVELRGDDAIARAGIAPHGQPAAQGRSESEAGGPLLVNRAWVETVLDPGVEFQVLVLAVSGGNVQIGDTASPELPSGVAIRVSDAQFAGILQLISQRATVHVAWRTDDEDRMVGLRLYAEWPKGSDTREPSSSWSGGFGLGVGVGVARPLEI